MSFFGKCLPILFAVLILGGLSACKDTPRSAINAQQTFPSHMVNGFEVPVFPSAEEQLNYTNSWFESIKEKKATLIAVSLFFPKAEKQKGEAALNLSYLKLGRDYRLAKPADCRKAIQGYTDIIARFASHPGICAKAYWYMGWIYSNLLHDSKRGVEMFDLVIADYPDTLLNLTPPVPWVTFVTPSALDKKNKARANRYWSDLARLEIIRHPDTVDTARRTFFELWHGNRNPEIIGISLKLMLNYHDLNHEVVPLAKAFLKKTTDTVLKNDISVTLEAVMRQPSEKKY